MYESIQVAERVASLTPLPRVRPLEGLQDVHTVRVLKGLRYASLAVLGIYTVSLCYRVGGLRFVLPRRVHQTLETVVDAVKARTEPIGDVKRFALTRRHLLRVYGLATFGMVAAASGAMLFHSFPNLPILFSVVATALPAALVLAVPANAVLPAGRIFCFCLCWLSAGYSMGPIAWVAQDTLLVFVLFSGFTMIGLCLPLFLTRGMVSYVVSAQILSAALSLCLVTTPKHRTVFTPFKEFKKHAGMELILNGDINVLLTMQLAMNMGICVLHTLPTIHRYISWKGSIAELEASTDELKEATCICAAWNYLVYRLVRSLMRVFIRCVVTEDAKDTRRNSRSSWSMIPNSSNLSNVNYLSGAASGFVLLLWYVRAVSLLQRGDSAVTLDRIRGICTKYSPLGALLGSSNVFMTNSALPN